MSNMLGDNDTVKEEDEYQIHRTKMETWKATTLIIGIEIAERLAYSGIAGNLVTYFTQVMYQDTASAARNVNIWTGVASILPFLGAFVADSYLGRYKTILWSSVVYFLGLVMMTIAAFMKYSSFKISLFFFAIYLIAVGQGFYKPCLQAFGADQFGDETLEEQNKSSFFNWWYFGVCLGCLFGYSVLVFVEEDVGWGVGFGILAAFMALAFLVFLCGTPIYLHRPPGGSPITNIAHVIVATCHKWKLKTAHCTKNTTISQEPLLKHAHGTWFRFLDKAAIADELDDDFDSVGSWRLCTVEQVTEVKDVICLLPFWVSFLAFGIVSAQSSTFFTKQGNTMRKNIGWFEIPAATLQSLVLLVIILLIPIYDKVFVPLARKLTGNQRGITIFQRIGTGLVVSAISMVVSALIEIKRINKAIEYGLVDMPHATIPMSIFCLFPQYILFGIADVFAVTGMQELFYEEMPESMKSLGIAIYLSVTGFGSILSGVLISAIQNFTCRSNMGCWFSSNMNKGHLDYFYWFLASLCAVCFCLFTIGTASYEYRNKRERTATH